MREVMTERIVPWRVNGVEQRAFLCTPEHTDELAFGHLFTQCGLTDPKDVLSVTETASGVDVTLRPGAVLQVAGIAEKLAVCAPCTSRLTVKAEDVRELCGRLLSEEEYFGTHRLVLTDGKSEVFREDVGRHNAADKCVAHGLLHGWQLTDCMLGSTGRISLEMLAKTAVMGIPVFFSKKYPSDIAVEEAERLGIAIIARAHTDAPAVYGATWRVL